MMDIVDWAYFSESEDNRGEPNIKVVNIIDQVVEKRKTVAMESPQRSNGYIHAGDYQLYSSHAISYAPSLPT